jgi:hypothetical protein
MNEALINSEGSKIVEPFGRFLIALKVINILIKSNLLYQIKCLNHVYCEKNVLKMPKELDPHILIGRGLIFGNFERVFLIKTYFQKIYSLRIGFNIDECFL